MSIDQNQRAEITPVAPPDPAPDAGRIEGVRLVRLVSHVDHRGSLTTLMDDAAFWSAPVVHAYRITIRPGRIKGWGMHRLQQDRYFICGGRLRVVLYDGRTDSSTYEQLNEFSFDETTPSLLAIPPGVWHADQNSGDIDAVIVNFPTRKFNPESPDKYRIDPHAGEIPFDWTLGDS